MTKKPTGRAALAKAAQSYLEAHSKEKFSLEKMAHELFINGSYLMRVFKHCTGMTPLYYHHLIRCGKAKELLMHTDMPISDIGETVGYVTSAHFSHIFHKLEGCTPTEYRNLHRSDLHERTKP